MARSIRTVVLLGLAALLPRCAGCGSSHTEPQSCPSGQVRCGGYCIDPATYATDRLNCGACGISCGAGTCAAGACQCGGLTLCTASNPRCADLATDRTNCGACGTVCPTNETCATGQCQCQPPNGLCGSVCKSLPNDPANCGACDNVCALAGEVCTGGQCECPTGEVKCPTSTPTACVDPQTDAANCGTCGHACAAGFVCSSGQCACPPGKTECSGACVDPKTDSANCGGCGNVCTGGATCACTDSSTGSGKCQTQHSNGLGQSFFDCLALGTYDQTQAEKAARAWQAAGIEIPGTTFLCPGCIGWQVTGTNPQQCGTWCFSGALQGRVFRFDSLACTCTQNPGTWN